MQKPPRQGPRRLPTRLLLPVLVLLPPVGLVLVWTSSTWRTGVRAAVTLAATTLALVGAVLAGAAVSAPADPAGAGPGVTGPGATSPAPGDPTTTPGPAGAPPTAPAAAPPAGSLSAQAALSGLTVRADDRAPDYDRDAFGPAWTDTDRNGCDTRNDVLRRDLQDLVVKPGTNGCVAQSGRLVDPWSGQTVAFSRGQPGIEIDHVVALADAWRNGASTWPYARMLAFANDPLELLAVPAALNQDKSDSDASEWLPGQGVCAFAARQVAVKQKYGLSVTGAERDALTAALAGCPDALLPDSAAPTLAPNRSPAPQPAGSSPPSAPAPPPAAAYRTCAEAKAAGAGPYVAGRDPAYALYADPDRDGVTCE